ncbi:MAG: STAS domain-containing protein [Fusobacteria bacterium]|jgi:anti-sigma B factor antagonist|nr:STAS domain-containing protein [Fusobacteriota bacterium]
MINVEIKKINNEIISVLLEGDVDVYTSVSLKKELNNIIEQGNDKILIDLGKTTYMDSSGLGVLVAILKLLKKNNGQMKIVELTPTIKKVFELTRLSNFFDIYDTEEDALKNFE